MHSTGFGGSTLLPRLLLALLVLPAAPRNGRPAEGTGGSDAETAEQDAASQSPQTQPNDGFQFMTVVGAVVREDGAPPPFNVIIERNCGGGYKREVEADSSGFFSFKISRRTYDADFLFSNNAENPFDSKGMKQQSGVSTPMPRPSAINVVGCELRALTPGYQSRAVKLSADAASYRVDIGKIVLYPDKRTQSAVVSVASLTPPKAAHKALERAHRAFGKRKLEEAGKSLKAALEIYPEYAEAWFWLGWLNEQQGRYQESRSAYEKAIAVDSNYARPYLGLAEVAGVEHKWQEMADLSERVLALEPLQLPQAYFLNAMAYYKMNNLDAAERIARKEQEVDAAHQVTRIHLLLSDILFKKNDLMGSLQELRKYLDLVPSGPDAEAVRALLRRRQLDK